MPPFDLAKTTALLTLFEVPRNLRDDAWRSRLFAAIVDASLASSAEQVMRGPDGFPYFVLTRPPVAQPFTPFCMSDILGHCTSSGLGIVVEPGLEDDPNGPEWVFTYGDLFSLRAYGSFEGDPNDRASEGQPKAEVLEEARSVTVGSPNEELLPTWARRVLSGFLKSAAKIAEPKVLVMLDPKQGTRNLVFNVHPENFQAPEDFQQVMNALGWFLPANRSCIALSRDALNPASFQPL